LTVVRIRFDHGENDVHSWEALEPVILKPAGIISAEFLAVRVKDFRAAAEYVCRLPYGRNTNRLDALAVIREGRGTCSIKHALLRRLALEQDLDIVLVIGIYEMNQRNTPGVGKVLEKYGLESLLEAHCYLRSGQTRIDVTREMMLNPSERITCFIHEEEISPDQIGDYKAGVHRRFLKEWMDRTFIGTGPTLDDLWRIREECIAAIELS
jgi:hypothetical protein